MSSIFFPSKHAKAWEVGREQQKGLWRCKACRTGWSDRATAARHAKGPRHVTNADFYVERDSLGEGTSRTPLDDGHIAVREAVQDLLSDFPDPSPISYTQGEDTSVPPPQQFSFDFEAMNADPEFQDEYALPNQVLSDLSNLMNTWIDESPEFASDSDDDEEVIREANERAEREGDPEVNQVELGEQRQRQRTAKTVNDDNPDWFPWTEKIICVLDVLRHLPRSLFSDAQMEVILWSWQVMGVDRVPSLAVLKDFDRALQSYCGIETKRYKGAFGNIYYVNDLASIIAQEMANPQIRPNIRHYPQDTGAKLGESYQAQHWLRDIDPTLATPMLRVPQTKLDIYVHEPAQLLNQAIVVPERFFTKTVDGIEQYFAMVFPTSVVEGANRGYAVHSYAAYEVPASQFLFTMPQLIQTYKFDKLPDPRNIVGIVSAPGSGIQPWTFTDPKVGNRWRTLATRNGKSHRVLSYMMWLYCDDTSGNKSKKWNKHNSFLFTAAGLPRHMTQQDSNIQFLCTSNIAPPLEMLDGIVDQLEECQAHGIWAWDCEAREMVLIIPTVLALLGDNPMQSELACHIGMHGKFFCRNCFVKGHDAQDSDARPPAQPPDQPVPVNRTQSESGSDAGSASDGEDTGGSKGGRRKETAEQLIARAKRFLGPMVPRDKQDSMSKLRSMFEDASKIQSKTRYEAAKTNTGLKDNFLEFFTSIIFKYSSPLRGPMDSRQERLNEMIKEHIPDNPYSPVWRIKNLDPHQDTPVEILHVILLGFVKYFWRDAMTRLSDAQKSLLITRIDSFNATGLALPSLLNGKTLVKYAGSLTGRDFRSVSQIAPFVLQGLVPDPCFKAWCALSTLVPLVWQPTIDDIEVYLNDLENAIDYFLDCTAEWTPRWFNKPKFHVIRHLPAHIRRFGPAILFATEAFESYNAVIRDHSVHSNHQAPSRDIGRGMARCSRIRHLLSGGYFHFDPSRQPPPSSQQPEEFTPRPFEADPTYWRCAGPAPLALTRPDITGKDTLGKFLGFLSTRLAPVPGLSTPIRGSPERSWIATTVSLRLPLLAAQLPHLATSQYKPCQSVTAHNGDVCPLETVVLSSTPSQQNIYTIGKVAEILQVVGSPEANKGIANYVLIEELLPGPPADYYGFPLLLSNGWRVIHATSILCSVNVQHNCRANQCDASSSVPIYQEREISNQSAPRILHRLPNDIMLNTAKMRDAIYVQSFRVKLGPLDREHCIREGALKEIQSQKEAAAKKNESGKSSKRSGKKTQGSLLSKVLTVGQSMSQLERA